MRRLTSIIGIDEARRDIRRIKRILRDWSVEVEDLPDDDATADSSGTLFQTIFTVAPAGIARYIQIARFKSLVEERTRHFVGREFVFQAIDEIIHDSRHSSGYILIRGEPGIGKTAIISELVRQRDYVHHINIAAQEINKPAHF